MQEISRYLQMLLSYIHYPQNPQQRCLLTLTVPFKHVASLCNSDIVFLLFPYCVLTMVIVSSEYLTLQLFSSSLQLLTGTEINNT